MGIEFVVLYPFVVSLSNHANDFFNTLVRPAKPLSAAGVIADAL